jgi:hypothetical protein
MSFLSGLKLRKVVTKTNNSNAASVAYLTLSPSQKESVGNLLVNDTDIKTILDRQSIDKNTIIDAFKSGYIPLILIIQMIAKNETDKGIVVPLLVKYINQVANPSSSSSSSSAAAIPSSSINSATISVAAPKKMTKEEITALTVEDLGGGARRRKRKTKKARKTHRTRRNNKK